MYPYNENIIKWYYTLYYYYYTSVVGIYMYVALYKYSFSIVSRNGRGRVMGRMEENDQWKERKKKKTEIPCSGKRRSIGPPRIKRRSDHRHNWTGAIVLRSSLFSPLLLLIGYFGFDRSYTVFSSFSSLFLDMYTYTYYTTGAQYSFHNEYF